MEVNALGQPVGRFVPAWTPPLPSRAVLTGRYCRLERLHPAHARDLFAAEQADVRGASWTYLPYGPFNTLASYEDWVECVSGNVDPMFYAIVDTDVTARAGPATRERAVGVLSYLRISSEAGTIEVGHVHYSPSLQRRRAATEAQYVLMRHAFDDLGYRRYEWKCDALNAASRRAAVRLGFRYEGTFRQALVVKGRNRDTAWYSIIDSEWPAVRVALTTWLRADNFDEHGRQKTSLTQISVTPAECRCRVKTGPVLPPENWATPDSEGCACRGGLGGGPPVVLG